MSNPLNCLYKNSNGTDTPIVDDNVGGMVFDGTWIYYTNQNDYDALYKIRKDGTDRTKLNDIPSVIKAVSGGRVYYTAWDSENDPYIFHTYGDEDNPYPYHYYSMKTDGTGVVLLATNLNEDAGDYQDSYWFGKCNGGNYYSALYGKSGWGIEKIRLDGKSSTVLLKGMNVSDYNFEFVDNWIYFTSYDDNHKSLLHRVHTDGTGLEKICDSNVSYFTVSGEWIYCNIDDGGKDENGKYYWDIKAYKMRLDGTELTKISNEGIPGIDSYRSYVAINGWLYYLNGIGRGKIGKDSYYYKMKLETLETEPVLFAKADAIPEYKGLIGTASGNNMNGGCVAEKGGWIYYANESDNRFLYKMRPDGTEKTRLNKEESFEINVVGDYVYYSGSYVNKNVICRIKTDGTGRTVLRNVCCSSLTVIGNRIYYAQVFCYETGTPIPFVINTDGTDKKRLYETDDIYGSSRWIQADSDWVYFAGYYKTPQGSYNYTYSKIRHDGTKLTKLCEDAVLYPIVTDKYIYFTDEYDTSILCRMDKNGKNKETVINEKILSYNISGEYIYYSSEETGYAMYRTRLDGSEKTLICGKKCDNINIISDRIYVSIFKEDYYYIIGKLYHMRLDGSDKQIVD